jgi:hypothetical protein
MTVDSGPLLYVVCFNSQYDCISTITARSCSGHRTAFGDTGGSTKASAGRSNDNTGAAIIIFGIIPRRRGGADDGRDTHLPDRQ